MNILEEMYYGNYRPNERVHTEESEYAFVAENIDRIVKTLSNNLSNQNCEQFEKLLELYHELISIQSASAYSVGFKMGTLMMIEVLVGNEDLIHKS
ncbi:DUF6809 family protein [Paenibacillus azoreducens]|uniref:Uncharacterized protein n=1 Tax=Paenibacillus azoreducens TaxID=116718 RepID=A0A919YC38_9BACL|nr:DUF6809 family protein [Paenibacillus azoreducens]GIO46280.1 hypothetical protein J34TS1_10450 [Paenibacillus azoreducens]